MGLKKITNEDLTRLLDEGLTQREIAHRLGVSEPAISKRVKRRLPPPKALEGLSEKEQRFCLEVAKGKTRTDAAQAAFDVTSRDSAKSIGHQLMKRPEVEAAISELMDTHGLTRSYRVGRLKQHVDCSDGNVSLKALDMSFKLADDYPASKQVNANLDVVFVQVDLSEFRRND